MTVHGYPTSRSDRRDDRRDNSRDDRRDDRREHLVASRFVCTLHFVQCPSRNSLSEFTLGAPIVKQFSRFNW
jgi:hypothetical protein